MKVGLHGTWQKCNDLNPTQNRVYKVREEVSRKGGKKRRKKGKTE